MGWCRRVVRWGWGWGCGGVVGCDVGFGGVLLGGMGRVCDGVLLGGMEVWYVVGCCWAGWRCGV